ncbi:MAG: hypothetical protein KF797_04490 [Flavobacteriales bacterium]|nr:hypothetical protein [Flavobacteriales bacterium]
MNARITGLAVVAVFACLSATAQQWTVYDRGNSPLPSATVKALETDGAGGVWVGTDWGLCHFDGTSEWTVYQVGTSPLVENNIRCLALDHDGRLWVGTESMGLQVKDGDAWDTYTPTNSPLPEFGIRDLFIDHTNAVWICTSGGLARFDGTGWIHYDDTPESHDGAVLHTANTNTVAVREDDTIILGTFNGGLHFIQGSDVQVLSSFEPPYFFDNTAVDVAFHPITGARWVAAPAAGLLRQQGPIIAGLWTQWYGGVGFPTNATTSIGIDAGGNVWVGSLMAGLIRVNGDDTYDQFTQENSGLPDNTVHSVLAAADGSIWAGTFQGGLARFVPNVGIKEQGRTSLTVFPNPASEAFTVTCVDGCADARWALFQADGSMVATGRSTATMLTMDVAGLPAGCYVLELRRSASVDRIRVLVD